jgi:hypothetical protein
MKPADICRAIDSLLASGAPLSDGCRIPNQWR